MSALKELDCVRVVRLLQPERPYDGTATVMRPPQVGDTGVIVHVHTAGGEVSAYIVESVNADGYTIWLADFLPGEIASAV